MRTGILAIFAISAALVLSSAVPAAPVAAQTPAPPPVAAVFDGRLPIGEGELPVFVSADWSMPLPAIRRAVIVIHGYSRNAADYARNAMALAPPADTLVVVPQFLAPEDIAAHRLADKTLRWDHDLWSGGSPALGPAPLSSFAALDAILAKLADRARLPNLTGIVVAGFSAGGQVVQRYAILGETVAGSDNRPIDVRYIVGSPSSYAYFGDERPHPDGTIAAFADGAACPQFNRWKYGFTGDLPAYAVVALSRGVPALERRYAERNVIYLAGANDNDPNHRVLDKSCAGEAQGPNRLARMRLFFADMTARHGAALRHHIWIVPEAAHNEARVFGSPCGRAALFEDRPCAEPEAR